MEISNGNMENVHKKISEKHLLIKGQNKDDDLTFVFDKIFDTNSTQ